MYDYNATVLRVVDGDTVDVDVDLGLDTHVHTRLRLFGINAPETYVAGGKEATAYLTSRIPAGTVVTVHTYKDKREKYGRYLADIYLGDENLNLTMIDLGYAVPYYP